MKNFKILENRPELTKEQIMKDLDFSKIKTNASIAKTSLFKSLITKGLIGIVIVSSAVIVYKNINPSPDKNKKIVLNDSVKTNNQQNIDSLAIITETKSAILVENIKESKKTVISNPLTKDTAKSILNLTMPNPESENKTYLSKNNFYIDNSKEKASNQANELNVTFGTDDLKEINKSLSKINENLYASKYEVSNKLYNSFLNSLILSKNTSLLAIAKIDTLKWKDKFSFNEPYAYYYHSHPAYQDYPVVNISFEAAKLFCEWLTLQYNADTKRKFKKVLFRLPTEDEWIIAAQAGDASAIYAWQGTELNNKKGQIMANFKMDLRDSLRVHGKRTENADLTAPVNSYWKNNYGLYNMSGNVAEMINEKGIAKGGSWRDNSEVLEVEAKQKYDGKPQVFVGFRYFMEIIEK
ncbi:MAG: SUMF1/EgtB/PvdO family nonheme iron enzyme [Bacteroidota bacterium]